MSDWRECELERIGGTIVEPAMRPENAVVAKIGAWLVRWDYEVGVHAARIEDFDRWATVDVRCVPVATGDDVLRLLAELDGEGPSEIRARVDHVEVFTLLDGGPVECSGCVTAWRPCLSVCPVCGRYLILSNRSFKPGTWNTERARRIYKAQRRDDAPSPHSAAWPAWIASVLDEAVS